MIKMMILLFALFSLLSVPALAIYASHDGLEGLQNYARARFSLGNLGFSGAICQSMFVGVALKYPQQVVCP